MKLKETVGVSFWVSNRNRKTIQTMRMLYDSVKFFESPTVFNRWKYNGLINASSHRVELRAGNVKTLLVRNITFAHFLFLDLF